MDMTVHTDNTLIPGGRPDRMVVGFITTYAIKNFVSSNPTLTRCTRYNIM